MSIRRKIGESIFFKKEKVLEEEKREKTKEKLLKLASKLVEFFQKTNLEIIDNLDILESQKEVIAENIEKWSKGKWPASEIIKLLNELENNSFILLTHKEENNEDSGYMLYVFDRNADKDGRIKLPIENVFPSLKIEEFDGIRSEIVFVIFDQKARKRGNFSKFAYLILLKTLEKKVDYLFAELEEKNFNLFRKFGIPFEKIGEAKEYLGGPCFPCMIECRSDSYVKFMSRRIEQMIKSLKNKKIKK